MSVLERMQQMMENTELSYRVMCDAHSELVDREKAYVRKISDMHVALLEVFHRSTDPQSQQVAAAALGIKMTPIPFPDIKRKRKPKRNAKRGKQ